MGRALIGLGAASAVGAEIGAITGAISAMDNYEYGIDADELSSIVDNLPAGGAGMLLVIEHTWAIPLRDAVRASGGIIITQDFLSPELLLSLGAAAAQG